MNILFQGDSITDAFRKSGEINPAYQLGNGYAFIAASRLAFDHPDRSFEFFNRGISGQRAKHLVKRWQQDTVDLQPDVVSILIGVNDVISAMKNLSTLDLGEFERDYRSLIQPLARNPALRIVLMEPFLLLAGEVIAEWTANLRPIQNCVRRIAGEFQTIFIPLQEIFDEAVTKAPAEFWAYDGIHPTHAGSELIARAWLHSVRNIFEPPICGKANPD